MLQSRCQYFPELLKLVFSRCKHISRKTQLFLTNSWFVYLGRKLWKITSQKWRKDYLQLSMRVFHSNPTHQHSQFAKSVHSSAPSFSSFQIWTRVLSSADSAEGKHASKSWYGATHSLCIPDSSHLWRKCSRWEHYLTNIIAVFAIMFWVLYMMCWLVCL